MLIGHALRHADIEIDPGVGAKAHKAAVEMRRQHRLAAFFLQRQISCAFR